MKRSIVAVIATVCLFMGGNAFALTVEEEIALLKEEMAKVKAADGGASISDVLGIAIEAGGTFVLQGISKANDGSDNGRFDGSFTFDLGFGKELDNGGMFFMHIEGGAGEGLNAVNEIDDPLSPGDTIEVPVANTYGSLNGDAGTTGSFMEVTEFWYEQPLFDNKVKVTFGKLNAAGYFDENEVANDETEQFLASMFVNNTAISLPDNNLGLRVTYSVLECLDLTYAYFNQNEEWNNFDTNGFNAVQATFKLSDTGNYRLMYWGSNIDAVSFKDGDSASSYGIAVSIDQAVNDNVSLFARYGYQNPEVYEIYSSWSIGASFAGAMWSRDTDTVGLAVGQNMASSDWTDAENLKDDSETQVELYYKLGLNDNVALTPVLQYVSKPAGGNAVADDDIFTFGIRTQISF